MNTTNEQPSGALADFDRHSQRVWQFFDCRKEGVFVEVGANHPTLLSQTGFLETQGWSGVLVEPNPELYELLRVRRPRSQSFQVAVGRPDQVGEVDLLMGVSHLHSTLVPMNGDPLLDTKLRVKLRTLDSVLEEAGVARIDFLSIDVEGLELEVLQGLTLEKYRPQLILLEDKHHSYNKYFYLRRHNYRRVKRTDLNDWYVPADSPATAANLNTLKERIRLVKKLWLNAPFDNVYRRLRKIFR